MLCLLPLSVLFLIQYRYRSVFHYQASSVFPTYSNRSFLSLIWKRYIQSLVFPCLPGSACHRPALEQKHNVPQSYHYLYMKNSHHRTPYHQFFSTALLLYDEVPTKSPQSHVTLLLLLLHPDTTTS